MAIRQVVFHPRAGDEARAAHRWYARRSLRAARRFEEALHRAIERVERAAEQGCPYRARYRWVHVHRYPYLIYYEIRDPLPVLVYAIAHGRRRTGYWLRRQAP